MALSTQTVTQLKAAITNYDAKIANLQMEIGRAQNSGIDVTSLQTQLAALMNQVRLIKQNYAAELSQ